jgi:hypothetical protein
MKYEQEVPGPTRPQANLRENPRSCASRGTGGRGTASIHRPAQWSIAAYDSLWATGLASSHRRAAGWVLQNSGHGFRRSETTQTQQVQWGQASETRPGRGSGPGAWRLRDRTLQPATPRLPPAFRGRPWLPPAFQERAVPPARHEPSAFALCRGSTHSPTGPCRSRAGEPERDPSTEETPPSAAASIAWMATMSADRSGLPSARTSSST